MSEINTIKNVEHLEELLSEPTGPVVHLMSRLKGDLVFLGVAGKMGPTMARMAKRATDQAGVNRRIIGVSRFSNSAIQRSLQQAGIETIQGDLLNPAFIKSLPDVSNLVYLAGMKFGGVGNESLTWAMNTHLPSLICNRYRESRIVALSSGNVYGLVPLNGGSSLELDAPNPQGEYAMSCLGRERIFEYFSRLNGTKITLIRLNYANELRYGVLVDLALKVWDEHPIDLTMGNVNVIWQGDANAMSLTALADASCPPQILNVAGPEILSVRQVCEQFGKLLNKSLSFTGECAPDAFLSDGRLGHKMYGSPRVSAADMIHWIADWVKHGGKTLGKPTHFEVRDGKY